MIQNTEVAAVADPEAPRTRERLSTGARSRRRAKAWHSPCSTCRGWRSANAAISESSPPTWSKRESCTAGSRALLDTSGRQFNLMSS